MLLVSAGAVEGYFERKTPREVHQGSLVLERPGTCNPEETDLLMLPWS